MRLRWYEVLFGTAIVALVALGVWWTLFLYRSVRSERDAALELSRLRWEVALVKNGADVASASSCPAPADEARRIEEKYGRRLFMVLGEGSLMILLIGICIVMLLRLYMQEARQVAAMRGFMSTVTHEMKTPIAGLKSLVQTAASGDLPREGQAEIMRMGVAEAERLEHLVENILTAGRLRLETQPLRIAAVRLGGFMDELVQHRSGFLARPGGLSVEFGEGAREAEVMADLDSVRVVLENLLDNAFKYGGEDPQVRVSVRRDGGDVLVEVSDRGVGFDPSEAEAIFAPFMRTLAKGASASHGTGLGLSIARELARRMGGDVTARSDGPGSGATFALRLRGRPA